MTRVQTTDRVVCRYGDGAAPTSPRNGRGGAVTDLKEWLPVVLIHPSARFF